MEQRPGDRPLWLPGIRPAAPLPAVPPPAAPPPAAPEPRALAVPDPDPPSPRPHVNWRRLTRSRRGAAGLAIAVAALLLWPFAGWSVIPWLAGIGLLVVLRLLRLDGLLRGWVLHLGGLVVVVGLMLSTSPWAWALAASIGVLLAGMAQLPWWRLAAVGAVLCLVSGVGFGFSAARDAQLAEAAQQQKSVATQGQIAEQADRILPILVQTIGDRRADPELLCTLLAPSAEAELARGVGAEDCRAAGLLLHARLEGAASSLPTSRQPAPSRSEPAPQELVLNGCGTPWAAATGPALGRIHIALADPDQRTYVVVGFAGC